MNRFQKRTRPVLRIAVAACGLVWAGVLSPTAHGQDDGTLPFVGVVVPAEVEARAGASDVFYPTATLRQGDRVEVHQIFYGWVKIVPPEGSFSFVSKGFVDPIGDGTVGEVSRPRVEVLAGAQSGLAADSYRSQVVLSEGERVRILPSDGDQQSDFYKVVPPRGAYVFLPPDSVRRAPEAATAPPVVAPEPAPLVEATPVEPAPVPVATADPIAPEPIVAEAPAPEVVIPPAALSADPVASPEAPVVASGESNAFEASGQAQASVAPPVSPAVSPALRKVEDEMLTYFVAPVERQPFDRMQAAYEGVRKDESLTRTDRVIVERRLLAIENNRRVLASLNRIDQVKGEVASASSTQLPDPADRPATYAAVGELTVSGVYDGSRLPRLFRIVEPNSQRTLAYVQPSPALRADRVIGRIVGVVGEPAYDRALRIEIIDPTRVDLLEVQADGVSVSAGTSDAP
ncbi:MAG: hypothetical protein AAF288_03280 [Planctomycetota bacterium]